MAKNRDDAVPGFGVKHVRAQVGVKQRQFHTGFSGQFGRPFQSHSTVVECGHVVAQLGEVHGVSALTLGQAKHAACSWGTKNFTHAHVRGLTVGKFRLGKALVPMFFHALKIGGCSRFLSAFGHKAQVLHTDSGPLAEPRIPGLKQHPLQL